MTKTIDEPEDATWEPIEGELGEPGEVAAARVPSLIYEPELRQRGDEVDVLGMCDDLSALPWGMWLGVAALVVMAGFVATRGAGAVFFSLRDMLIALALLGVGIAAFRYGPSGRQRRVTLATIDLAREQLAWPTSSGGAAQLVLDFAEIAEVVFAMIYFPVSPSRPDERIHVFTVLVRQGDEDGELVPVIEATPDKRASWAIAQQLARVLGVPLAQVGEGVLGPSRR